ncbi:MAG: DUF4347 domain-containing protein [Rubripirellula sp.]
MPFRKPLPARRRMQKKRQWTLAALEPRMMLAGDLGAAIGDCGAESATRELAATEHVSSAIARRSVPQVIFIDGNVEDIESLVPAAAEADIVLLQNGRDPIAQISEALAVRRDVGSIHLVSHGAAGEIELCDQAINESVVRANAQHIAAWSRALRSDADILIYGCRVGDGNAGETLVRSLAEITGADVAASTNQTGSAPGSDWRLERTVGIIESSLAFAPSVLANYEHTLPITIRAAGSTGQESMSLQIDGVSVQSWDNIGGDFANRQFETFTYSGGAGVTGDQVRVVFTNDLYNPPTVDRNLRIDSVEINGVTIQTEDAGVFSTGTWLPQDGITPGFRQSEALHTNGYFEYFNPDPTGSGSQITIRAAGVSNDEVMDLRINGQTVNTWSGVGGNAYAGQFQNYSFTADQTVSADQIQIAFTNDLFVDGVVDRNLRIDWIEVDGQRFETEAPSVFSTGTWLPGIGVTSGFHQNEFLHTNGYFQYDGGGNTGGGESSFAIVNSQIIVDESAGVATVQIERTGDLSSTASIDYQTFDQTAVQGDDYRRLNNTIVFNPNENIKNFTIPIYDDSLVETSETLSFTIDNPSGAGLGVPRTATITILDNDLPLPNYANFLDGSGIDTSGGASITNGKLQVTSDAAFQTGAAFYDTAIVADSNTSFQTTFSFEFNGGFGDGGADGIVFVLQNSAAGSAAIGTGAGGLGYAGIANSIGIELDTWQNGWDQYSDEVAVVAGGDITNQLEQVKAPFNLNFGGVYHAWIDYNGISDTLSVYVSQDFVKPTAATLQTSLQLDSFVGNQFYAGFTSANYDRPNAHRILSWSMNLETPPPAPPVNPSGEVSGVVVANGLVQPTAIDWSPDGRNLYIAEKAGVVKVIRDGQSFSSTVFDISSQVNDYSDRGLLDIAVHPDLQNNPYLYLLYTYDPPEVYQNVGNVFAGPDQTGNRAGRLLRLTLDASTNYTTVVSGSETLLLGSASTWANFNGFTNSVFNVFEPPAGLNPDGTYIQDFINSDSTTHSVGSLAFGTDGNLFVSIGDGASYNDVDGRAVRVQDIDSLSGKILRINPITGQGVSDNPFYNGNPDANRSKVYQLGLRNPFRISVDDATGQLFIGDVGWTNWEEVNTGAAGANFGWPFYEGGEGVNFQTGGGYANLAEAQAFYASGEIVTAAPVALNHAADGINAIVVGDVVRGGNLGQQYEGNVFFNDLGQGIVRNATIDANGVVSNVDVFATGAQYVVAMRQGPDGSLYYVDLLDGEIGRWEIV